MPSFILEKMPSNPLDHRRRTTLHCKKSYSPGVKVTGWEYYRDPRPIDNDPYCPEAYNLHYSHYNRLGTNEEDVWSTATRDMLRQIHTRQRDLEINYHKPVVNTSINVDCKPETIACSTIHKQDFSTTMQHSYQSPYPYKVRRLPLPETPFFLNRYLSNNKVCQFLDDDYIMHINRLQAHKSLRHISYNPCTGYYTDGSEGNSKSTCTNI